MNKAAATPVPPVKGTSAFITGLGIAQICSWGTLFYSFPLIATAMEADLGWSKMDLYWGATIGFLLSALFAVPVGAAIDRGLGRYIMAGASLAAGLFLFLWSLVDNIWTFYVVAAAAGTLQAATLYEPTFAVIARRAGPTPARNGITAVTLWAGFSSTIFVPLVQILLDRFGWRGTLEILAAINFVVCAGLYFIVIDPRRDPPTPALPSQPAEDVPALRLALRNKAFWGLAIAFTAYMATFSVFTFHFYPMMLERGFDAGTVVMAIAMIGPAQVAARFLVRLFGTEFTARRIGVVVVLAFPLAMTLLTVAPAHFWIIALGAMLYGAANGIMTIVRGVVIPEMITQNAYGAINGALAVPMVLARALAPLAAAWLWAAASGYMAVLFALIATSMLITLSFWWAAWESMR